MCGILLPTQMFAGEGQNAVVAGSKLVRAKPPVKVDDVASDADGTLRGRCVLPSGMPLPERTLIVYRDGLAVAQVITAKNGSFAVSNLRSGEYTILNGHQQTRCRLWSASSCPPAATKELLLVEDDARVVRGQQPFCAMFGQNPIMVGVLVAAAIAIPIAVHNGRDSPPGS